MSKIEEQIGEWAKTPLINEFGKHYMKKLSALLRTERMKYSVQPSSEDVFKAYRLTAPTDIKVVILGQDPYPHEAANGLAFSCEETIEETPASLQNIFKEINDDIRYQPYHDPDLTRWAKQGVFLLNRHLTVRAPHPGSHHSLGWDEFTDKTLEIICQQEHPIVFLLWGREAQKYGSYIPSPHHVIHASHPSPWSAHRGFFGSKCFSRANKFLKINYNEEIDWLTNEN